MTYTLAVNSDGTYTFSKASGSTDSGGSGFKDWSNVQMFSQASATCKKQ